MSELLTEWHSADVESGDALSALGISSTLLGLVLLSMYYVVPEPQYLPAQRIADLTQLRVVRVTARLSDLQ